MSTPVLTLFNNKGGVGKTSLVFHLAWMLSEMGKTVVALDLDPQANLTSAFLPEESLEELWLDGEEKNGEAHTIYQCLIPLTKVGDILSPSMKKFNDNLFLVPGDLSLAGFEDFLSREWPNALGSSDLYRPFRILSSFWLVGQLAARQVKADLILADVGPNLGAINRSALIGTDAVLIPLAADLFSLQGLRNLGPTLNRWRADWTKRLQNWADPAFDLPQGTMRPLGYVLMQHGERLSRPVKTYEKWVERIPSAYDRLLRENHLDPDPDPCLALIRHYRSLAPLAQEARKPIFKLTSADGAIGSHAQAVSQAREHVAELAQRVLERLNL
ncbi:ParA family protein [Pararhodospirillum oryzae]|uniref:Chromosome partitioning protein ParA n=1 Tax=Pararhodospirillum oryzae TaxID=478448 RepID=A0A512H5X2_9PROT|nr:AAA family ATPase [Pararhodospirillum oryzae]GEO80857.1 chromosome partitioning protein ParA [Pararhodospirillum oryzae]